MKILLICDYGRMNYGAERQMFRLRELLLESGHDARLFTSIAGQNDTPISADDTAYGTDNNQLQGIIQVANISAYRQLRRTLAEFQPDVVHVQMFLWQLSPLILPLLEAYPTIYHICIYKVICPTGTKLLPDRTLCEHRAGLPCLQHQCVNFPTWLLTMTQRKLLHRWHHAIDRFVVVSHAVARLVQQDSIHPTTVVYNGIPERCIHHDLHPTPLIVFSGRLEEAKGVDVLLHAMRKIVDAEPSATLLIAGDGRYKAWLEALTVEMELSKHVSFLGYVNYDELENLFESAWLQIIPSIWAEPFGNVVAEAMMRGTVPIASNIGGVGELIQDGVDGILVPPNDVDALSSAIVTLLGDYDRILRMRQLAHQNAIERFGETRFLEEILSIYHEVMKDVRA